INPGVTVNFTGGWNPTGTNSVGDAGTLTNVSGVAISGGGTLNLSGGSLATLVVPVTASGATVNISGATTAVNGATLTSGTANTKVTFGLNAANNGKLNLQTANAFQGGAAPANATAAPVSVSTGGAVGTGGFTQTFSTITVNGTGILDLS